MLQQQQNPDQYMQVDQQQYQPGEHYEPVGGDQGDNEDQEEMNEEGEMDANQQQQ